MTTEQSETTTQKTPALVREWRTENALNLREAGELLGISHNAIAQFENGIAKPDRANVARWMTNEDKRVRRLANDLFAASYSALIQNVLVPTA